MINYNQVKRLFDIILCLILLTCLLPIFVIIAVFIRLQDGGPAIFRQERIGKKGVVFRFYKFRSMPLNTPNVETTPITFSEDGEALFIKEGTADAIALTNNKAWIKDLTFTKSRN